MSTRATQTRSLTALTLLLLAFSHGPAAAVTISNTATVDFLDGSTLRAATSNTVNLDTIPAPSQAVIELLRYAPGSPASVATPADGGSCLNSAGVFAPAPPATDSTGTVIDTTAAPILDAASFQLGEAVFIRLTDANRNLDSSVRDFIELRVTTSTADEEVLRLQETAIDTGVFVAALQSAAMPPAPMHHDCRLSVARDTTLVADYTDILFPADTADTSAVVEPISIVFDSSTGLPVDGVTVTLLDAATGAPATVFGLDGTSPYPATVVSGATVTDASGHVYPQPAGGYQFPVVVPGDYVLQAAAPTGYGAPSTVPLSALQALRDPAGNPYVVGQGSFGDTFDRPAGPATRIDLPIDPMQSGLLLQKSASTTEVAAGDFLQYQLTLQNLNSAGAVTGVQISDTLPLGMRYQAGSLRIAGQSAADPAVDRDGRTLTITVGTLAAAGQAEISYVVQVGAGTRAGDAVNRASATASGGLTSNVAQIGVRIREPFLTSQFTIIGRVVQGECGTPWHDLNGVPDVRVLLDDGTYVPTDQDGQFHFEGVRPGTHVVQLDLDSLPPDLEVIPCIQNSRFAGRAFSQFVEAQGGALWRTDFYVRPRVAEVGIRLQATLVNEQTDGLLEFRVELDGGQVWIQELLATVQLPDGVSYSPGSTRIDGADGPDPQIADGFATFRLGDPGVHWRRVIEFKGRAAGMAKGGGIKEHTLRAQFDSGKARLKPEAVAEVDRLIAQLRDTSIKRIEVVGHTDSQHIAPAYRKVFRDNDALSQARARAVAQALAEGLGLSPDQISTEGRGPREPVAGNDTPAGMARNRRVEVTVVNEEAPIVERMACPADGLVSKAVASFATQGQPDVRTPIAENRLSCSDATVRSADDSSRKSIAVTGSGAADDADAAHQQARMKRRAIPDDPAAAGADIDWLSNQSPGTEWLFPAAGP